MVTAGDGGATGIQQEHGSTSYSAKDSPPATPTPAEKDPAQNVNSARLELSRLRV